MPKISIIVPIYNVERYLDRCMNSLINQTLKDIEIIMVDDESPDRCPQMCDEYAIKDSRIKVIHKKNEGLGMACNSGIIIATGEYIAFCDSDDWVDIEMYETMYNEAKINNADAVYSSFKYVDLEGNKLPNRSADYNYKICKSADELKKVMKDMISSAPHTRTEHILQSSAKVVLYKNDIIRNNNLRFVSEREIPSEDLIFNLNYITLCKKVVLLPKRFYNYRTNPSSISHSIKKNTFDNIKIRYEYLIELVRKLELGDDGENRVKRVTIGSGRGLISRIQKSNMQKEEKQNWIKEICEDSIWRNIWCKYPLAQMPLKHLLFFSAMRYRQYWVLKQLSNRI